MRKKDEDEAIHPAEGEGNKKQAKAVSAGEKQVIEEEEPICVLKVVSLKSDKYFKFMIT